MNDSKYEPKPKPEPEPVIEPFDYASFGINGEPEHNTDGIFCWCAPTMSGDVVIHQSLADILSRVAWGTPAGAPR